MEDRRVDTVLLCNSRAFFLERMNAGSEIFDVSVDGLESSFRLDVLITKRFVYRRKG